MHAPTRPSLVAPPPGWAGPSVFGRRAGGAAAQRAQGTWRGGEEAARPPRALPRSPRGDRTTQSAADSPYKLFIGGVGGFTTEAELFA